MLCCKKDTNFIVNVGNTKLNIIRLERGNLFFDIANECYNLGESLQAEDQHVARIVQDIANEYKQKEAIKPNGDNSDIVTRHLDTAYADLITALHKYVATPIEESCHVDDLNYTESYLLPLHLPPCCTSNNLVALRTYTHDYMVYKAMYLFLMNLYPKAAENYAMLAERLFGKIGSTLAPRYYKARKHLHPF